MHDIYMYIITDVCTFLEIINDIGETREGVGEIHMQ